MKNKIIQLNTCLLMLFTCCHSHLSSNTAENQPIKMNEILFINLKIEAKNAKEKSITLINSIKSEGKLKSSTPQYSPAPNATYIICTLLNAKKKKIDEIILEHPLLRDVESFEENGHIQQNSINISSAEFSLRIQNMYDARFMIIKEVIKGTIIEKPYTINL